MSLATATARGIDARDVERALHEALDRGIRLVDVSEEPEAERLCGDAIRALRLRDSVTLASRIPPKPSLPARYIQERVELTLRAARLDAIPLAQLPLDPAWCAVSFWPELAGTCARLVREGKVMQWGAIVDGDVGALANEPWLVSLSLVYNACARIDDALLDGRQAILARQPLAGAALAGTLGPGMLLALHDDRRILDDKTLERVAATAATLSPLVAHEPAAARSCDPAKAALESARRTLPVEAQTLAELALRYVCDRAIALPRLHRREHLADAITAASAPPLSRAVRDRIDEVLAK